MRAAIQYTRDEINSKIPYAIIVENWNKKSFGKGKREYIKTFTSKEIQSLAGYFTKFRKWYLVRGVPESCMITIKNVNLLQRAGDFFANV